MSGLNVLLTRLRRVPEPLKQRLRPVYFRLLSGARAVPGGRLAARALARAAPGLHAWLRLRFDAYQVLRFIAARPSSSPPDGRPPEPPAILSATEVSVFRRLASRQAAG